MIRPIQAVGSYIPVHPPIRTQATHAAEPAFGLKTVSFGAIPNQPQFITPPSKPHPSVGNRLDYFA